MKTINEFKASGKIKDLVATLFEARQVAHNKHLQSKSYAEHKALGEFYTQIGDLVDDFVESYQGKYGLLENYPAEYNLPGNPIQYLNYLKDEVLTLRNAAGFPEDTELQNTTDEIATLINSTLYKLRFLA